MPFPTSEDDIHKLIVNYKSPNIKQIDLSEFFFENGFPIVKTKNSIYVGAVFNMKRHGLGLVIHSDGSFYEGEWRNNLKHGHGYEQF